MRHKEILSLIPVLLFSLQTLAQDSQSKLKTHDSENLTVPEPDWPIKDESSAGIVIRDKNYQLSSDEYLQLVNHDFNPYRLNDERTLVKILDGPQIELYSIREVEAMKIEVDPDLKDQARKKDLGNIVHKTMPVVDVGIRKIKGSYPKELESQMHQ